MQFTASPVSDDEKAMRKAMKDAFPDLEVLASVVKCLISTVDV